MAQFQAKRADGRADWRVIFDFVEQISPGETVGMADLLTELESDDVRLIYRAMARANRELWATRSRSMESVRGVGYRMLQATEHEHQSTERRQRARRQMKNSLAIMQATDLDMLSPDQRKWAERVTQGLVMLGNAMDVTHRRLSKHEGLIEDLRQRITDLEEQKK